MRWRLRCPRPAEQCPVSLQAPPAGPSSERVLLHSPKPSSSLQHLPGPGSLHLSLVGLVCLLFCLALSWGRECRGSVRIWSPIKSTQEDLSTGFRFQVPQVHHVLVRVGGSGAQQQKAKGLLSSVQFSRSIVSDSVQPHESQHTRPPCLSPTPGLHSDSHPSQ